MFACAMYPGSDEFLDLVRGEAEYQVKRLAHRACLALWCGNNEIEYSLPHATPERKAWYDAVFTGILPAAVERFDGATAYWPSSPHNPEGYEKGTNSETAGDCHFWEVWHSRKPVKTFEAKKCRFYSEFGMQSYSSPHVAETFCPPGEFNIFGPAMENHQKNKAGNGIILDYLSKSYRFPKDYASLAYLSQLNQAYAMKVGVEHFRRSMPRTMGALYWQLNDCWPVFSWSSIEFDGTWKALHWAARRFFAPALVSAYIPGDEIVDIGNIVVNDVDEVHLYTVYDGPEQTGGEAGWTLFHLDGRVLDEGRRDVLLSYGESGVFHTLRTKGAIKEHGVRNLILRIYLDVDGVRVSEDMIFLTAPRFIEFRRERIDVALEKAPSGEIWLTLCSSTFHPQTMWEFRGIKAKGSDNYLDLYPGEARSIEIEPARDASLEELKAAVSVRSLVDSY
jgi:beta-mannosidase